MIEASVAAIDRGAHGMRVLAGQRDAAIDVDVDAEPDPEAEAPAP